MPCHRAMSTSSMYCIRLLHQAFWLNSGVDHLDDHFFNSNFLTLSWLKYNACDKKNVDRSFTVGENISCLAFGIDGSKETKSASITKTSTLLFTLLWKSKCWNLSAVSKTATIKKTSCIRQVRWDLLNWVKLNSDGSSFGNPGRDWHWGFN